MALYKQILTEVRQFLPPQEDVEGFVTRQCRSHLQVEPEALSPSDLPILAWWIGISASLLIPKEQALLLRQKVERLH